MSMHLCVWYYIGAHMSIFMNYLIIHIAHVSIAKWQTCTK